MKNRIKTLLCAGLMLGASLSARADDFAVKPLQMTNTALEFRGLAGNWSGIGLWNTNAAIATALASNYYINVPTLDKYGDVTIGWGFKQMSGSASDTCKAVFDASANGNDWQPSYYVLSLAASGTTRVFTNVTITLNSLPYLRLAYITNGTATTMTNITVEAVYKPRRFGP